MAQETKNNEALTKLLHYFGQIEDPRNGQGRLHKLVDILIIIILAVICGCDDWTEIEDFGKSKENFLSQFLALPHGIPSHDTFGRVFSVIHPEAFQKYFALWINELSEVFGDIVNIDGKQLRGSMIQKVIKPPFIW